MPRVYRAMTVDNGRPLLARSARGLGVRVGSGPTDDIPLVDGSNVVPGTGGMSVSPRWQDLPYYRIPRRLKLGARGKDEDAIWRLGDGHFLDDRLSEGLSLRVDSQTHGLVEPSERMLITDYEKHLHATCNDWVIDET